MLSSQARYWLNFFAQNPFVQVNYRALMERGVSRRRSMDIMRELKDSGSLRVRKSRGNGTKLEVTTVVSSVSTVVQNSSTASSPISNSSTASTVYSATNKFLVENEEEGKSMGWDFFSSTSSDDEAEELLNKRKKHEEHKKQVYKEKQEAKAAQRRDFHRSKVDPANWTCKDVAYEFADRVGDIWGIKPFSVVQSRFVPALSQFRKQQGTDGAIELELINLFFDSIQSDKYTDGNHLWRAFLYKAPSLLQTARERVVTPEQVETAIIRDSEYASKKLSMFDEDDDVQA